MKGFHISSISLVILLGVGIPAAAQDVELADTLEMAVVYTERTPVAFTGLKSFDRESLLEGAALLGTPDVIKVLQNLPGVASGMELMSGLYVHGGDGSDNLFLLDGVPLFQISHLAGLFSSFNTDIVRSMDFYKSSFPARYGGKLSSVVDVKTEDGSMDDFHGSFSIGLIDGRINLNGPIVRGKLSYDVSFRRSWLDAVLIPVFAIENSGSDSETKVGYSFFDTNVNLTYTPTVSDKINIRFFGGTDRFKYGESRDVKYYGKEIYYGEDVTDMGVKWGNRAASASWDHVFSCNLRFSSLIYYSSGYSDISAWQKTNFMEDEVMKTDSYTENSASRVNAIGVKGALELSLDHHRLSAGLEYRNTGYTVPEKFSTNEASVFAEDEMTYGRFSLSAGVRLDGYFTDGKTYFCPQPRLSASYSFTDNIIAKASYESMSQYSHLLSSIYIDLPTNLWMPSTSEIRPSESHQVAAGIYWRLSKRFHADISGYYRTIDNCLMYSGDASIFPKVDRWEEEFISGKGRSYGAELEFRYLSERLLGTLAYTLSWNERSFADLHHGWFKDRFDNRHKLTIMWTYRIKENIDINATWNYHSGNRITVPEHMVFLPDGEVKFLFSEPYNAKMPDYHRLDLSCSFHKQTRRGNESIWNISIYNAYCRMNPIMMRTTIGTAGSPVAIVYSLVPIIPSFSYTFRF